MNEMELKVVAALGAVRESGQVNMFDRLGAADVAESLGFDDEAEWLRKNPKQYMNVLTAVRS